MATLCERPKKPASEEGDAVLHEVDSTLIRPLPKPPAVGDLIAEKYRLMRTLGRGGMGRIFAADHLLLGTTVALKFMHPHLARERGAVARFGREARAAAMLKSVHAARIIDVDQLPSGELYIVMEYLEGTSLETIATEGRGLATADAVTYIVQACDAIAEAHENAIVHRDVKPANLFLTKGKSGEPVIKVLDFGLAKSTAPSTDGFASTGFSAVSGQALGTPNYMAPEQINGSPVDGRADIWAIGATLYELLTGRLAFPGENAAVAFDEVLKGPPPPLRAHRPDVPEALVAIVERCLTRDPGGRFASVRDLVRALEAMALAMPWTASVAPRPAGELDMPFVAGPITTARFVTVPAPAPPRPPVEATSDRACILSMAPPPATTFPDEEAAPGPTARQTLLAALAGPLLIAIAAGAVAIGLDTDVGQALLHPGRARASTPSAVSPTFITARSGDGRRSKAAAPEKAERSRR